jgi:hypothetical protein
MKKVVRLFVVPALVAAAPVVFAAAQQSGPQTPVPPIILQPNPVPPVGPNTSGPVDPTPTQPPPTGSN